MTFATRLAEGYGDDAAATPTMRSRSGPRWCKVRYMIKNTLSHFESLSPADYTTIGVPGPTVSDYVDLFYLFSFATHILHHRRHAYRTRRGRRTLLLMTRSVARLLTPSTARGIPPSWQHTDQTDWYACSLLDRYRDLI